MKIYSRLGGNFLPFLIRVTFRAASESYISACSMSSSNATCFDFMTALTGIFKPELFSADWKGSFSGAGSSPFATRAYNIDQIHGHCLKNQCLTLNCFFFFHFLHFVNTRIATNNPRSPNPPYSNQVDHPDWDDQVELLRKTRTMP